MEAKKEGISHLEGYNQAVNYAGKLGLRFAYTTNGHEIEFMDLKHGIQQTVKDFHSPDELWEMYQEELYVSDQKWTEALLHDYFVETGVGNKNIPRYYQEKAVNKAIESVISGQKTSIGTNSNSLYG